MRRWNGWGDDSFTYELHESALDWLESQIGKGNPHQGVELDKLMTNLRQSALPDHALISKDREDRIRHSIASSLPDWVAKRFGRIPRVVEGVAYPEDEYDIRALFKYAKMNGIVLIPFGGGTSVVGGINPEDDGPASLSVDMAKMNRLESIDEKSHIATFGAGVKGPDIEKQLEPYGLLLGHFPQSYELSTLGGWIAARSSGQQSLKYGRIEHHYAGGRFVSPVGIMEMSPYPASAAGPDLREIILGSEGRMGIITSAEVRVHQLPEREEYHSVFFQTWDHGADAVRELIQTDPDLSMIRLSNAKETEANLALAGHENLVSLAHNGLNLIGHKRRKKCMLLVAASGRKSAVRQNLRHAFSITRKHGGFYTGQYMGKTWERSRFRSPYLRNTLWEHGYAIDTLESILPWNNVADATRIISEAIEKAAEKRNQRIYVFAHLSHLYNTGSSFYVTYIFKVLPDPEEMLDNWKEMKTAASEAIVSLGGTISHQHGVGVDHAPYLEAEKGSLGMSMINNMIQQLDPDGIMNPGKLLTNKNKEYPNGNA